MWKFECVLSFYKAKVTLSQLDERVPTRNFGDGKSNCIEKLSSCRFGLYSIVNMFKSSYELGLSSTMTIVSQ